MPDLTQNYQLRKPLADEFYDIGIQNGNMDALDSALKEVKDSAGAAEESAERALDAAQNARSAAEQKAPLAHVGAGGTAQHALADGVTAGFSSYNFTAADKAKLDGVAAGANKYTHPATHAASMITEDAAHRFVTDTEKAKWDSAAGTHTHDAATELTGALPIANGGTGATTAAAARTALGAEPARSTVTQTVAEAGTSTTVYAWTPERVKQAAAAACKARISDAQIVRWNETADMARKKVITISQSIQLIAGTTYTATLIGGGGGGGAGGGANSMGLGGGGGGGGSGYVTEIVYTPTSNELVSITIGAGGTSGSSGGTTLFGSHGVANGGGGGGAGKDPTVGAAAGGGGGGSNNGGNGGFGGAGISGNGESAGNGGTSAGGSGGGGGASGYDPAYEGSSFKASSGASVSGGNGGGGGIGIGAGGGGGGGCAKNPSGWTPAGNGGNGASGAVIIKS